LACGSAFGVGFLLGFGGGALLGFALLLLLRGNLALAFLLFFGLPFSFALALDCLLLLLPGFLAAALGITALLGLALRLLIFAALGFPLASYALIVFSDGTLAQRVFLSVGFLLTPGTLSGCRRSRYRRRHRYRLSAPGHRNPYRAISQALIAVG
jgi:hypothetical protein